MIVREAPWKGVVATLVRARALSLASALVVLGTSGGCTSGTDADGTARDAAIYESVIADLADQSGVGPESPDDDVVLFIESLDADDLPLEVQVEVIDGLDDRYEVRFIDARDEAVDIDLDSRPVRPGSLLIGLGPIVLDGLAEVQGELYLSADEVRAYQYTLTSGSDGSWDVAGSPEVVDPLVFGPES